MAITKKQLLNSFQKLKKLFATPNSWCQGTSGMTTRGVSVGALHPDATRWCTWGGIRKIADWNDQLQKAMSEAFVPFIPRHVGVIAWNDNLKTRRPVINTIDKIVKSLSQPGRMKK